MPGEERTANADACAMAEDPDWLGGGRGRKHKEPNVKKVVCFSEVSEDLLEELRGSVHLSNHLFQL